MCTLYIYIDVYIYKNAISVYAFRFYVTLMTCSAMYFTSLVKFPERKQCVQ